MKSIGDEIRHELARFGPQAGLGEVVKAWPIAVGAAIAANAWPARIGRDGTLHVATSSSAWAFELTHLEATVRAKLTEHLEGDGPPALRFAPGSLPEPGAESVKSPAPTVPKPSSADLAVGEEIAAGIEDPRLRGAAARAIAASLAAENGRLSDGPIW
jgi:predicted nucleic acid-binding Zn ribbon protein